MSFLALYNICKKFDRFQLNKLIVNTNIYLSINTVIIKFVINREKYIFKNQLKIKLIYGF